MIITEILRQLHLPIICFFISTMITFAFFVYAIFIDKKNKKEKYISFSNVFFILGLIIFLTGINFNNLYLFFISIPLMFFGILLLIIYLYFQSKDIFSNKDKFKNIQKTSKLLNNIDWRLNKLKDSK